MIAEKRKLSIPTVLLAAGKATAKLGKAWEGKPKALLPVAGISLLERALSALDGAPCIPEIAVVGLKEQAFSFNSPITWIPEQPTWIQNIYAGADHFRGAERLLFLASDLPLLSQSALVSFLEEAARSQADISYPIIQKETLERHFVSERTYAHLREGYFTGGNAILIDVPLLFSHRALYEEVFAKRKSVVQLTKILGPLFLLKLFLGRLTLEAAQERVSQILGAQALAIPQNQPELFLDIDKEADLRLAEEVILRRSRK